MDKFKVKFKEEIPKYVQIQNHFKILIEKGKIEDGERLPSIRVLSEYLGVNKDTIINCYNKLKEEGYATQKVGSGTYAKRREQVPLFKREYSNTLKVLNSKNNLEYIDFVGEGTLEKLFPIDNFKNVLNEVLDRDGASAFIYRESLGYEGLRRSISREFGKGQYDYEDILIVSGAQQGIDVVSKAIINQKDNVIVEKPTYSGALSVFNFRRANIIDIPLEEDGINLELFEKFLMKNKIKCFYTMSCFQNPSGVTYSIEKKKRILQLAEIYDFFILEDDYLSELVYNNIKYESLKSLDKNGRVIYIKSFSKIFLPGIRLGYLVIPPQIRESVINFKVNTDISTSSLMQRALDVYMQKGYWKEHMDRLRNSYKVSYDTIVSILDNEFTNEVSFFEPKGGLNIYLTLNVPITSVELFYKCKNRKLIITPGVFFYKDYREGLNHFKLGFSNVDYGQIREGMTILKEVLQGV